MEHALQWRHPEESDVTNETVSELLHGIELGQGLRDADRESLAELAAVEHFDSGSTIFREGERHPFVYWVIDGQVSLEMSSGEKTLRPLLTLVKGDLLAWSALLTDRRMSATAKAIIPTRLLQFETLWLLDLCEQNHEVGYRVMQHLAAQLAQRLLATRLQLLDLFSQPGGVG